MPRSNEAPVMRSPYVSRNDEVPVTKVLDLEEELKVTVLAAPDPVTFGPVVQSFTKACHCDKPNIPKPGEDVKLEEIVSGAALWQSMETLHFNLLVSGCSRVFTHQLVRARVGVTFSQQCFGDTDMRHADLLVHRYYGRKERGVDLEQHIAAVLRAKGTYAGAIDAGIPLQAARRILPHNLATFIHIHGNLMMLSGLYKKRVCTMSQDWETVLFARRLKNAIVEAAPWAAPAFMDPCEMGNCWYHSARSSGFSTTNFYIPDAVHDNFPWNPKSFIHDATNEGMNSGPVRVKLRVYSGLQRVG